MADANGPDMSAADGSDAPKIPRNTMSKRLKFPEHVQGDSTAVARLLKYQQKVKDLVKLLYFELDIEVYVQMHLPPSLDRALEATKKRKLTLLTRYSLQGFGGLSAALSHKVEDYLKSQLSDRAT
jgi:hypothetical protein